MEAWIARDRHGTKIYLEDPQWDEDFKEWDGDFSYELEPMVKTIGCPLNTKQPITLTATPAGDAKKGAK